MIEEERLIHIRCGGKLTHSGVEILPNGKDIEYIVIDRIEFKEKENVNGKEISAFLAYFAPNPYTTLPMVLNLTNKRLLCKLAGVDEWTLLKVKNFPVRLTREETRQMGWGLRISKLPPIIPPVLNQQHPNWDKCVAFVKSGGKVNDMRSKYIISTEIENILKNGK